ncbi:MAG: acyloxyacyl hydrolase [Crocinitomicaceae bacterium]|nr:acyloxyacyl hydrolase [Crocinitomicaceae bacterium]
MTRLTALPINNNVSRKYRLITLCFFSISFLTAFSQQNDTLRSLSEFSFNQHLGRLIKIYEEFPTTDFSTLSELSFSYKTRGKKEWHIYHKYPSLGGSLIFIYFGNSDTLGNALGLVPTAQFEYDQKKGSFFLRAGLGIAAFNRPYRQEDNPGNLVLGSTFENLSVLHIGYSFFSGKRLSMSLGLSATHCSNSHLRVPNVGANIFSVSCGLRWSEPPKIRSMKPHQAVDDRKEKNRHLHWNPAISLNFGLHEFPGTVHPIGGPLYPVYGCSLFASRVYRMNGRISLGASLYYYSGYYDLILSQQLFPEGTDAGKKSVTVSIHGAREWIFGRFGLIVQAGVNIYSPFLRELAEIKNIPSKGVLYQWTSNKVGYRYSPLGYTQKTIKPFAGISVKANGGTADFFEVSIGIVL